MVGKVLKLGAKTAWWAAERKLRGYRTESTVALGLIGAAVTAAGVLRVRQRNRAFRGKVVVITGGSRGLGLEIARQFGRAGAHLVLAARDPQELQRALAFLHQSGAIHNGFTAHTVVADVRSKEDCRRIIEEANGRYGRVDVLVNCAGVMQVAPIQDQTDENFEQAMDVHLFAPLHTTRAVLPQMLERGSGNIVNIASIGGKIAVPHMLPYVASKFALVGFSEGLHAELRHSGVRVTTVCPGLMRTGSHIQVEFGGRSDDEYRWFMLGATTPGLATSARGAARKIFRATVAGQAEITITPQAWLAARFVGLAPGFSAWVASWVDRLVLPKPNGNHQSVLGKALPAPKLTLVRKWSDHLIEENNQADEPALPSQAAAEGL